MLSATLHRPRYVGTAPGTTTLTYQSHANSRHKVNGFYGAAGGKYPTWPPPGGGPGVPPYPTQAWLVPEASNIDRVRIALPSNQSVSGMREMIIDVPAAQKTMGPVPNDRQIATMRNFQPVQKGWIDTNAGKIFTLQGFGQTITFQGLAQEDGAGDQGTDWTKWATIASLIVAAAVAATSTLAILEYRKRR
ncbi:hypothetical protein LCGC14_1144700 [marine sediment metagenome]|uniref:Uncharacterized protein n=1 Tax=marine sediment metagenome TaxID=412755 RepID=A0A0F9PFG6_9ZZZZ